MSTRRHSATTAQVQAQQSVTPDKNTPGAGDGDGDGEVNVEKSTEARTTARKRRLDVNPNLIISEERSKRRRTPTPDHNTQTSREEGHHEDMNDPKDFSRAKMLGMQIYNVILAAKDSEGGSMSQPFVKLPNKRAFPDYYETIKHPMSLEIVHAKLEKSEYQTLKEVCADIGQIFNNAKRYNVKESLLFQYAKKLHKTTRDFYETTTHPQNAPDDSDSEAEDDAEGEPEPDSALISENESSIQVQLRSQSPAKAAHPTTAIPTQVSAPLMQQRASVEGDGDGDIDMGGPSTGSADGDEGNKSTRRRGAYMQNGPSTYKLIKPVLKAIKEAKSRDGRNREIATIFAQLPDPRELPDYYRAIKTPISLEEIETKQLARRYDTWQEFFDDVELMCKNALAYNEDGSEVYRDAQQILDLLAVHRNEIPHRIANPNAPKYKPRNSTYTPTRGTYAPASHNSHLSPAPMQYTHSPGPASNYPPGPSAYPSGPSVSLATGSYLPALPPGVVTEELVASLERYPAYEQQAWIQSLSPLALNVYRQMLMANEARKRGIINKPSPGPVPVSTPAVSSPLPANTNTPLSTMPTTARPAPPSHSQSQSQMPTSDRQAPPVPTIKYLDFHFSAAGDTPELHQTLRLHNMRGVVTHCVILNAATSEVELTAYVGDPPSSAKRNMANPEENGEGAEGSSLSPNSTTVTLPEVSLRVNGNQGSLPRFVFPHKTASIKSSTDQQTQPKGMRWTIGVPISKYETKIEVVATKPGALAETSTIFVNRQM